MSASSGRLNASPRRELFSSHNYTHSLTGKTTGSSNGRASQHHNGSLHHDDRYEDAYRDGRALSRMGSFLMLLFNLLLLGSGIAILTVCLFCGSPVAPVIRSAILPSAHALNILFYSLIVTAACMCFVAVVNVFATCCCPSKPADEYKTSVRNSLQDAEMLMLSRVRDDPDLEVGFTAEFQQSSSLSRSHYNHSESWMNGQTGNTNGKSNGKSRKGHSVEKKIKHPSQHQPGKRPEWTMNRTSMTTSSQSAPASHFFCFLIFMLLFLFTVQLTVSFIGFVSTSNLEALVKEDNQSTFIDSLLDPTSQTPAQFLASQRSAFDKIEAALKCCGLHDFSDYISEEAVPESCCRSQTTACGKRKHPSNIYYEGCSRKMQRSVRQQLTTLSCLSLGFSSVAAAGLVLSCCLYVRLISQRSRGNSL